MLGLWTNATEGSKFWMSVLTDLRNRGVKDLFIVCVDGLKGFPQAIETTYPQAQVQSCIVHMVRASLNYVNWKERKRVAADLKPIYRATTGRTGRDRACRIYRELGSEVSSHRKAVAGQLVAGDPVFRIPGGDSQGNLHHQCGRIAAYEPAQSD